MVATRIRKTLYQKTLLPLTFLRKNIMAKIEGFSIRNYGVLKDITLGKLWDTQNNQPLTPLTVIIGKNGSGKSTLFDVFGFLADCLKLGVEEACDARGRGGFDRIRSQGCSDSIKFQIYYRQSGNSRPITYEFSIDTDKTGRPYVKEERLRQRRKGQKYGRPYSFLWLNEGLGLAWKGEELNEGIDENSPTDDFEQFMSGKQAEESSAVEIVGLQDNRRLGIATLGALKQHPRISAFRQFIEGWHLSYFTPDAARSLPLSGPQRHLNARGDNLGNVVQFMEREHPDRFRSVLDCIARKIPGIESIDTETSPDKRLLLRFNDKNFQDPFYAQQMSDGTLKVFAYLLLIEDPKPPPFICIEEPENGLYHQLLEILANEFGLATERKNAPQIFVTTHQPYFVDALSTKETWVLEKEPGGFSRVRRASDNPVVNAMVGEDLPLGSLWYSSYLDSG